MKTYLNQDSNLPFVIYTLLTPQWYNLLVNQLTT